MTAYWICNCRLPYAKVMYADAVDSEKQRADKLQAELDRLRQGIRSEVERLREGDGSTEQSRAEREAAKRLEALLEAEK